VHAKNNQTQHRDFIKTLREDAADAESEFRLTFQYVI